MKISKKLRHKIAQKILDQIEPIHCDDPKVQAAFREGHDRVMRAANLELRRWVILG